MSKPPTEAQKLKLGLDKDAQPCACQDCDWRGDYEAADDAKDILQRHDPGDTFMDRECPECGALIMFLSFDQLMEHRIEETPVPEGLTRYRVVQQRDAYVNYHGYVDAESVEDAYDKGCNDDLVGGLDENWLGGDDHDTYDSRNIGVDSLDGETLMEPKED